MKTEQEIVCSYEQTLYEVDKQLKDKKFSLEEVAVMLGGVVHFNHPGDFSVVSTYLGGIGEDIVGLASDEIVAMGNRFLKRYVHPESIMRLGNKCRDLCKKEDERAVCTDFQRILNVNTKSYEWWMTSTKVYKIDYALFAISIPVKNMGVIADKMEKIIAQDLFMRQHFQQFMTLTKREKEVLQLVAEGYTSKDIAENFFISKHTVLSHRKKINKKLGICSFRGIIQYAQAFDLI